MNETKTLGEQIEDVAVADTQSIDPLAPDAPIHHLLSLRHNPLVADMPTEALVEYVKKLRVYASSAPTLSAKLSTDGEAVNPTKRKTNALAARKKALLDEI